jgi:hypothetical protein
MGCRQLMDEAVLGEDGGEGAARRRRAELGQRDDVRTPSHELPGEGGGAPAAAGPDVPGYDPHGAMLRHRAG